MHMNFILVVTGLVAITSINCTPRSEPDSQDLFAHSAINWVRANPKLYLGSLESMLCSEYNKVPSPGGTYDSLNNLCMTVLRPLWGSIGPIIAKGKGAKEFCDSTIRQILKLPPAPERTCKTPNMGEDKIYTRPNGDRVTTNEGRAAVEEAIAFLKAQKPLPALGWNIDMWKACRDHGESQAPTGATGHTGPDGSSPLERMERYGHVVAPAGENLGWGSQDPYDAILQLIIDDGVASRGHRLNIFKDGYYEHGSYYLDGGHQEYGTSLCSNFCSTTWTLAADDYETFVAAFLAEPVTFIGADEPAGSTSSSTLSDVEFLHATRQLKKTTVRTYTLADGTTKPVTKISYKDIPAKNTV